MSDPQDHAEALDPAKFGEGIDEDTLPGLDIASGDRSRLASEDPAVTEGSTETDESLAARDRRRTAGAPPASPGLRMAEDESDAPSWTDDEKDLVASSSTEVAPEDASAEEAAMRVIEPPPGGANPAADPAAPTAGSPRRRR